VATEREARGNFLAAVAQARSIRGSVNLDPPGGKLWSAVVFATDGSLELRIAPPPRRWFKRHGEREERLRESGFQAAYDHWVLPLTPQTGDAEVAERWSAALADGLGVDPGCARQSYVSRGVPAREVPPASASHEEHILAGMHAIVRGEFDRLNLFGGRTSELWAWVWDQPEQARLLIERQHRDDPDGAVDEWHVPRTLEGCREGARELLRRLAGEWPEAERLPLFVQLLERRPA
jgi:hypothetical protein